MASATDIEPQVRELARSLYREASAHKPSLFEPQDWIGRMIDSSLADESLRTALFRFVDVLPSLDSAAEIGRHLREYFAEVDHALGGLVFLAQALHAGTLVAPLVRHNVVRLARRFIAEEESQALAPALEALRVEPAAFTLDVVGEATVSEREAAAMERRYLDLMRRLADTSRAWKTIAQIDASARGPLARVNLSVKLSALCARFDPLDPDTEIIVKERLRNLFREAIRLDAALTVDMEQVAYKDLTLAIFRSLLEEEEFSRAPAASIAIQAYLRETENDLQHLIRWAKERGRRIGVRLVKGAYWDSEIAWAEQKNWPIPVFLEKAATDASYERLSRLLLENYDIVDAAFGSHNLRSVAHAIVTARALGVPDNGYEIQMLFGMAEPVRRALVQSGRRVRVYLPVGELLPGMAYLIRRLMENTSNASFLRQTYAEGRQIDALVATPVPKKVSQAKVPARDEFTNEPPLDFSRRDERARFAAALEEVQARLGDDYPLWIGGANKKSGGWIESVNPAAPEEIVGRAAAASTADVEEAVVSAREFFPSWRATPAAERAAVLFRAAAIMRERRVELAAWEVFEVGKSWREADADVIEAIDYLEYYGREMLRRAEPRLMQRLAGESDTYFYEPRGIAAIIAPWNFPLAIPTGMTAAALVAGNCVLFKPAEQSPVLGFHLVDILRAAGLPPFACHLLQGGGEIGAALVRHPAVHLIAFTGSRDVGLEILREAGVVGPGQDHVKRVISEMGGKNAIIVDADADLDEAIAGVIDSAFGYQGQKCSAASRLILVEAVHDRLLERLVEAARSLKIGPTQDPRNNMGPLIEAAAKKRVQEYIGLGRREGTCVLQTPAPAVGYFVGPAIFAGIEPQHRLAQEEIFGPVLAVMRGRDFAHALELANASAYALTGGVFSRSPAHIEQARREFRAGNLYINRGVTGAVVGRQPFGGFKLSGIGSKAGGPDYLLQFLEPRTVSENTLRHGFVPPEELTED